MKIKHYFSTCNNFGKLVLLIGFMISVPLILLLFYPDDIQYAPAFLIPSVISLVLGLALCMLLKREDKQLQWRYTMQYSSLTVLFAWGYGFFIGALPFVIAGQLTFIQALFESVSGWTTTGLSVMDVTVTPPIFLFYRSFMQFCGGLGFVMVMMIFIQGKLSMNLFNAEGHSDKLMPNLKKTARVIATMYTFFLLIGVLLYRMVGMSWFDGINHAMAALSTGGFSTKLNSIGDYNSIWIELITVLLMVIGTTNFAVLLLLTKGRFKQVFQISEIKFMFGLLAIFVPLTALSLIKSLDLTVMEGFRRAFFDVTSAFSTTGYSTMSYASWPPFAIGILILLMLIGGGIGSTAGGIKQNRIYLLLTMAYYTVRKRVSPDRNVVAPYYYRAQGKTYIDNALMSDTTGFVVCYLIIYVIGTLLLTLTANASLTEAMFEFASALGTVGLSIGLTGPGTNSATLIVEIVGMVLGRLEIFIVLMGIYSSVSLLKKRL